MACFYLLHRRAGVHTGPSVSAVNVDTGVDATLTHAAAKRRTPQHLELSVPSCTKLHVKNAPFETMGGKKMAVRQRDIVNYSDRGLSEETQRSFLV